MSIQTDEKLCGSGGCWRQLTLRGPERQTADELVSSLDMPAETCHVRSLLDRRRVCTGVTTGPDDEVRIYVQFHRRLNL